MISSPSWTRSRSASALAILLAIGAFACRGNDTSTSEPAATEETASAKQSAPVDDLQLIPADSAIVIGANVAQLVTTRVWKEHVEPLLLGSAAEKPLAAIRTACGFDPISLVRSFVSGDIGVGSTAQSVTVVRLSVIRSKLEACLQRLDGKTNGKLADELRSFAPAHDRGVYTFENAGMPGAAKFLDDTTVLLVIGAGADRARVEALASGGPGLRRSTVFREPLQTLDTEASVWAMADLRSPMAEELRSYGLSATAVYGSVQVGNDLKATLRLRMPSADTARTIAEKTRPRIARALREFPVDKLDITSVADEIGVTLEVSPTNVNALSRQIRKLVGGDTGER